MKYKELQEGRSFVLRLDNGENLLEELLTFFQEQRLQGAVFWVLGALEKGQLVGGPQTASLPPEPINITFNDTREIVGWGNIARVMEGSPKIHLHMSAGRNDHTYTGCLRKKGQVFLTSEIYLREIINFPVRKKEMSSGIELLDIQGETAK